MNRDAFDHYLHDRSRFGGPERHGGFAVVRGRACGDTATVGVTIENRRVAGVGWQVTGCGATEASAAALCALSDGAGLFEAARLDATTVAEEVGGLSPAKSHAAEVVAEAFARSLSRAVSQASERVAAPDPNRVLVAMSGGVDSGVSAELLHRQGRDVVGVTLKLWSDPATDSSLSCCSPDSVADARRLAGSLGIPHFTLDLEHRFRESIVRRFVEGTVAGITPNPCVHCNGEVRFDEMLAFADKIGASTLATGHYAAVVRDARGTLVAPAFDRTKDQSYVLSAVDPTKLGRVEFPLGSLAKETVREMAREYGLSVAEKPESQDLCFTAGIARRAFLERMGAPPDLPGEIVDEGGSPVGAHAGRYELTVGQRRGLGIAASRPLYVTAIQAAVNRVVVGTKEQAERRTVVLAPGSLYRPRSRVNAVRLRYQSDPVGCVVRDAERAGGRESIVVDLERGAVGVAPGQIGSLLDGEVVVGWGIVASSS